MKLLLLFVILLQVAPVYATHTHRLPLSHRTNTMAAAPTKETASPVNHVWKLSLLGLAALSFVIRKRL